MADVDNNGQITRVYPARVGFRGFTEEANTEGYIKVSQYIQDNASELIDEAKR
ncbi:conserved domain protein [Paenibacillus sp. HGF5]|nr:conserved domain protein [Paenibacillus sp. HGF5]